MNDRSSENLVGACQQGDKNAYLPLVERHYKGVFAVCLGMLGNIHDAEDIAQDAMLKGFLKIDKLGNAGLFWPWILQIARNLCIDFLQRQKRHEKRIVVEEPATEPQESTDDNHALHQAIKQLPWELRVPLVMYYFDGKNAKAVAEKLGISHSGVCQRIRTARKQLHELLTARVQNEQRL